MNDDWAVLFSILVIPCLVFGFIAGMFHPGLGIFSTLALLYVALRVSLGRD